MGYFTELNTLVRFPKNSLDPKDLAVGKKYTITRERERTFPLHIAMLLIDEYWNFYGYCVAHEAVIKNKQTTLTFEVLTLFSPEEQKLYKQKFLEAAKMTGEVA